MLKKKFTFIATGLIIVVGLLIASFLSKQKEAMKRRPSPQGKKPVKILTVKNQDITTQFEIGGHLTALDKADIFAEVSGILLNTPRRFREGTRFSKG